MLKNILITVVVITVMIPIIYFGRKITILIRAVKKMFGCIRNLQSRDDDIPLTIIERPSTAQTVVDEDLDLESEEIKEETGDPLIPVKPTEVVPSAPDKIGM